MGKAHVSKHPNLSKALKESCDAFKVRIKDTLRQEEHYLIAFISEKLNET